MLTLDTITRSLMVSLKVAVTTNQLHVTVSYADHTNTTFVPKTTLILTNNTADVVVMPAPPASTQRQMKYISVFNADTKSATVTIKIDDSGVKKTQVIATLAVGHSLVYNDHVGWTVLAL
jgi:hypothetical protein